MRRVILLFYILTAITTVAAQDVYKVNSGGTHGDNYVQFCIIYDAFIDEWQGNHNGRFIIPIDEDNGNSIIDEIIEESKNHIGTPYRAGCTGKNYFDCSGFMKFLFGRVGIRMNASSSDQYRQGVPVKSAELKPGDLVFFKGSNASSNNIGHVGMVTEADNEARSFKFIHATVSYGIIIDHYPDGGYYSQRYVGARRIIPVH